MPAFSETTTGPEFRQFVELLVGDQPPHPGQDSVGPGIVRGIKLPLHDHSGLELSIGCMEYDRTIVSAKSLGKRRHDKVSQKHFMALIDPNQKVIKLEIVVDPLGRLAVMDHLLASDQHKPRDPLPGAWALLNEVLSAEPWASGGILGSLVEPLPTESKLL